MQDTCTEGECVLFRVAPEEEARWRRATPRLSADRVVRRFRTGSLSNQGPFLVSPGLEAGGTRQHCPRRAIYFYDIV